MYCLRLQQPRSLHRLNLVGQKQDQKKLAACMKKFTNIEEVQCAYNLLAGAFDFLMSN
jgi:hypothetical protein